MKELVIIFIVTASKYGVMTLFCDEKRSIKYKRKEIENKGQRNRKTV
jgi:hypothetical protein